LIIPIICTQEISDLAEKKPMEKKHQSGESAYAGSSGLKATASPHSVPKVKPTEISLLLDVPPELRIMVYDLLLVNRTMVLGKPP
jgi:hypothetical protein